MTRVLSLSTAALSLLGAALLSTAASATDFSEGADFGGTYGYIGPGVASLPAVAVGAGAPPGSRDHPSLYDMTVNTPWSKRYVP